MRKSGVLMPIFSLPGKYGIGCFSKEAYKFVDFLEEAGQNCWQILPLGPTGYGDSPYQSFSTYAGNPYFISLEKLMEKGLLTEEDCKELELLPEGDIDYGYQYEHRYPVLRKAFDRWKKSEDPAYASFIEKNSSWISDYSLFMALKDQFGGVSFQLWDDDIRFRKPEALAFWSEKLHEESDFYSYLQYEFSAQWTELKAYANAHGVDIIGDIPIYVSPDSSDFWANPELFVVDENARMTKVAGCPPDGFSEDGQLWGNPVYNWKLHEETGFAWWLQRMEKCVELYDVIRIDHFRGFDEYYEIPAGAKNAVIGEWVPGPGMKLFNAIREHIGDIPIIAEDLGFITDSVKQLVKDSGYPNMKIIEFAFDSRDEGEESLYLPHTYTNNCVVYTGTHDNETLAGYLTGIKPEERENMCVYLDTDNEVDDQTLVRKCIRLAEGSVADLCVIPMQDWLGLDNRARINEPSTLGKNWKWRMLPDAIDDELPKSMYNMARLFDRISVH